MNDGLMLATACLVGLGVSAPLGPVALLALRRGLAGDGGGAALTGCGAGLADGVIVFATLAASALVKETLEAWRLPLSLVGGGILIVLAVAGAQIRSPEVGEAGGNPEPLWRRFVQAGEGFGIAITNPGNIAAVSAVTLTALARPGVVQPDLYAWMGFVLGSQIWWIGLGFGSARLLDRLAVYWLRRATLGMSWALGLLGLTMIGWAVTSLLA